MLLDSGRKPDDPEETDTCTGRTCISQKGTLDPPRDRTQDLLSVMRRWAADLYTLHVTNEKRIYKTNNTVQNPSLEMTICCTANANHHGVKLQPGGHTCGAYNQSCLFKSEFPELQWLSRTELLMRWKNAFPSPSVLRKHYWEFTVPFLFTIVPLISHFVLLTVPIFWQSWHIQLCDVSSSRRMIVCQVIQGCETSW